MRTLMSILRNVLTWSKNDEERKRTEELVASTYEAVRAVQEERATLGLTRITGNPVGDFVRRGAYDDRRTGPAQSQFRP